MNASNLEDAVERAATELVPVWVDTSVVILGRADGRRFVLDVKGLTAKTFSWLSP